MVSEVAYPPRVRAWRRLEVHRLFSHPWLRLERHTLAAGEDRRDAFVVDTPDWINVVPLTADDRVVMIRQWRYGIAAPTLEIPGGLVDPGEDHATAAARELEEETGYRAGRLERLGTLHPNPAIQSNRIVTFLATDLAPPAAEHQGLHGVDGEEILVELVSRADLPRLIAEGAVTHALVVAAFHLLGIRPR